MPRPDWSLVRRMNIEFFVLRKTAAFQPFVRQGFTRNIAFAKGYRSVRLLVVEDDKDLNRQIAAALTEAGYAVDRAFDGEEGWVLSAGDRWRDTVQGFDAGADDYVAKPFHIEEILAQMRALLRRAAGHATSEFRCGPVHLDARTGRVSVDGNPVKLTSHEYGLLSYLMHHAGRIVSRGEIIEHLYEQDFDRDSNTIEVFVGRLRKKLGVEVIQTMRGLGYLLAAPETKDAVGKPPRAEPSASG